MVTLWGSLLDGLVHVLTVAHVVKVDRCEALADTTGQYIFWADSRWQSKWSSFLDMEEEEKYTCYWNKLIRGNIECQQIIKVFYWTLIKLHLKVHLQTNWV